MNHYDKSGEEMFKKIYAGNDLSSQPEEEVVRAIREARTRKKITQSELSRRTGIDQGDISKLEHGTRNPSLKLLKRLANGLDMDLVVMFVPREEE